MPSGPLTVERDTALAADFAGDRRGGVEVGRLDLRVAMFYLLSDSANASEERADRGVGVRITIAAMCARMCGNALDRQVHGLQ